MTRYSFSDIGMHWVIFTEEMLIVNIFSIIQINKKSNSINLIESLKFIWLWEPGFLKIFLELNIFHFCPQANFVRPRRPFVPANTTRAEMALGVWIISAIILVNALLALVVLIAL